MKRLLLSLWCLVFLPAAAAGQIVEIHVYHAFHDGAAGSSFRLETGPNLVYLSDHWSVPIVVGNSQDGVQLSYGGCLSAPTYLGKVVYFSSGPVGCDTWVIRTLVPASSPSGR